ncbi:hypothetical protein CC1G_04499 [Coprinopsis cinerea okayama7|uniref:Uncharacterized protein n=1 Tax=Coprinopsis cinerea (strain Okayama-7 / 130 / ATCC MYA-4618 / FGSC 9003) TaxID=240176 RepID=A8N5C1_COPC7|nr:hypothetical protein CC1G_04499 [Coprinopsis cinerea okayama7\|eukprot:XP_001830066.1 hypothetical protein CC1G_04499 [Coprinopsis cinerea okayama7\
MVVQYHDIRESTEVPVRISGARATEKNPYTLCLGCNGLMEASEGFERTKEHNWHEECIKDHSEHELEDVQAALNTKLPTLEARSRVGRRLKEEVAPVKLR